MPCIEPREMGLLNRSVGCISIDDAFPWHRLETKYAMNQVKGSRLSTGSSTLSIDFPH